MINTDVALVISSTDDENGAISSDPHLPLALSKLGVEHNVETVAARSISDIKSAVKKFEKNQIRVLWIRAHGSHKSIKFENNERLTNENLQRHLDIFTHTHPECTVFLDNCAEGGENKLAQEISKLTQRTVFAAENESSYAGRIYLVRSSENNNKFEMRCLNNDNKDISVKYENGEKRIFEPSEQETIEMIEAQGYSTTEHVEAGLPLQRLELMHRQFPSDGTICALASHHLYLEKVGDPKRDLKSKEQSIEIILSAAETGHKKGRIIFFKYFSDIDVISEKNLDRFDAIALQIKKERDRFNHKHQKSIDHALELSGKMLYLRARNHIEAGEYKNALKDFATAARRGQTNAKYDLFIQAKEFNRSKKESDALIWLLAAEIAGHPEAATLKNTLLGS